MLRSWSNRLIAPLDPCLMYSISNPVCGICVTPHTGGIFHLHSLSYKTHGVFQMNCFFSPFCAFICRRVFIGDVVVLKDPETTDNYLVRRLAAIEGYEMVSTSEEEQPFTLERDQCWVLADDKKLKPKVSYTGHTKQF